MPTRYFHIEDIDQWFAGTHGKGGPFRQPPEKAAVSLASALGFRSVRCVEVEDGAPDPREGVFYAPPEPEPEPIPDPDGYMLAVFEAFGKVNARQLARDYPDSTIALEREQWTLAREAAADMLNDAAITREEYDVLMALMRDFNIPEA